MREHRRRPRRPVGATRAGHERGTARHESHRRESSRLHFAPRMSGHRVAEPSIADAELATAGSATRSALQAPGTFLDLLTSAEREGLMAVGHERTFPRGAVLMYQDEPSDRIVLLLDGRVKVTRIEGDGRESLLSIRDPGDVLGELSFVDGQPRIATVSSIEPVRALVATPDELRRHLERTPRVAVVLLEILVARFRESTLKRTQFANTDTMGRLAARIVELAERYGEPEGDAIAVESPLTREDLAAWTGASRAGAAEALKQLRELGWIDTERRKLLVLDIDALRKRAG
jgi:CRP/FNR family cyclic AMP-dependent transcriptional regulator